jgi:hypothetical protein
MRISEILVEARKKTKDVKVKVKKHDDFDDMDTPPADPDTDKIPHIVMQLRKALDVDGDYPIKFNNLKSYKLKLDDIKRFLEIYQSLKPVDRESMQVIGSRDLDGFHKALTMIPKPEFKQKIKGNRYMSHFRGDFDDK